MQTKDHELECLSVIVNCGACRTRSEVAGTDLWSQDGGLYCYCPACEEATPIPDLPQSAELLDEVPSQLGWDLINRSEIDNYGWPFHDDDSEADHAPSTGDDIQQIHADYAEHVLRIIGSTSNSLSRRTACSSLSSAADVD